MTLNSMTIGDKPFYNLFLDDCRNPDNVTWIELPKVAWQVVRSYGEFIRYIECHGIPRIVSFDCDLAPEHYVAWSQLAEIKFEEPTGCDCVKWLVEFCRKNNKVFPIHFIHTRNLVGMALMNEYIQNHIYGKFNNEQRHNN